MVCERYTLAPTKRRRPKAAQVPARARQKRERAHLQLAAWGVKTKAALCGQER